jgi:hypothetical protein
MTFRAATLTKRDFRIGSDDKWFRIVDVNGREIKKFSIHKYDIDHVRAWRDGYLMGLNTAVEK